MHVMEQWPNTPAKAAGLAAVRATIKSLEATPPAGAVAFECIACASQRRRGALIEMPSRAASQPNLPIAA